MKNILVVAPASYPVTGAEHIVNIKLIKVLSDAGFKIDLVSKLDKWENYPSISLTSLGTKINNIKTIEVDNKLNFKTIYQHFLCFIRFGVVYKGCHWAIKALPIVNELVRNNQYDYILTKNAPGELVGFYLKKRFKLKWVATWNDPYPSEKYPEPYGKGINGSIPFFSRRQIPIIRKYVDIHIFPSDRLRDYMNQYLKVNLDKTRVIPHVVIPNNTLQTQILTSPILKIIHSGKAAFPRDPAPFLKAFQRFIYKEKEPLIQMSFLGIVDKVLLGQIKDFNLEQFVDIIPPVNYFKSIELLSEYHVAVIIEAACEEGIFLPTKVTDYLQYNKTIFAISPRIGVLKDLFKNGSIKYFADCTDTESIENELLRIYQDFKNGVLLKPNYIQKQFFSESIVAQYDSF